eukprot:scaffold6683_cov68-Cyclotella_meneghiniana.AAC.8
MAIAMLGQKLVCSWILRHHQLDLIILDCVMCDDPATNKAIAAYSFPEGDLAIQLSELMQCPRHVSFIWEEENERASSKKVSSTFINDPRMPTLSGICRRDVPPTAVRLFCERTAITGGSW